MLYEVITDAAAVVKAGPASGSLERTAELYGAIAESARWHAERLSAASAAK